jgi:ankyrin repeat protein
MMENNDNVIGDVKGDVKINNAGGNINTAENDIVGGDKITNHYQTKHPLFHWSVYVGIAVLLVSVSGFWIYVRLSPPPSEVRAQIEKMDMDFDAKTFIKRAKDNDIQAVDLFLQAGIDPNEEAQIDEENESDDKYKVSALQMAAANGHLDMVKKLLGHGANLDKAVPSAAVNGQKQILDFMLEKNPSQLAINKALIRSAGSEHTDIVQLLLDKGADVSFINNEGDTDPTALIRAASSLKIENARLLLSKNANVNAKVDDPITPSALFAACSGVFNPLNLELVDLLLEHGADVNIRDKDNSTPLLQTIAANNSLGDEIEQQRLKIVQSLLNKGADLTVRAKWMESWQPTPLLAAIHADKPKIALLLIEQGAEVNDQSGTTSGSNPNAHYTALMQASEKGMADVVKALIDKGAEINTRNEDGDSALLIATGNPSGVAAISILLDKEADVTATNNKGRTALMNAAILTGYFGADDIELLIKKGVNVNATDGNGWTALMFAADGQYENADVVKKLLDNGADIAAVNNEGDNALNIATKAKYKKIVKVLNDQLKK